MAKIGHLVIPVDGFVTDTEQADFYCSLFKLRPIDRFDCLLMAVRRVGYLHFLERIYKRKLNISFDLWPVLVCEGTKTSSPIPEI